MTISRIYGLLIFMVFQGTSLQSGAESQYVTVPGEFIEYMAQRSDRAALSALKFIGITVEEARREAFSSSNISQKLANISTKVLDNSIERGGPKLGHINLNKVRADLAGITWAIAGSTELTYMGSGDTRTSAMHLTEEKIVVINLHLFENINNQAEFDSLLLHEALGAAGYDDEDYKLTAIIVARSQGVELDGRIIKSETKGLDKPKRKNKIYQNKSGGGTSVGGGGDIQALGIKIELLRKFQDMLPDSTNSDKRYKIKLLSLILDMKVVTRIAVEDYGRELYWMSYDRGRLQLVLNGIEYINQSGSDGIFKARLVESIFYEVMRMRL